MSSTERINARTELAIAVAALRDSEVTFLEGIRRVLSLRGPVGAADFDPDFMVLVAIDSESDHLPNPSAKAIASVAWLSQSASEVRELKMRHSAEVYAACERLVQRFAASDA